MLASSSDFSFGDSDLLEKILAYRGRFCLFLIIRRKRGGRDLKENIWRIMTIIYFFRASSVDYCFGHEKLCFTNRLKQQTEIFYFLKVRLSVCVSVCVNND